MTLRAIILIAVVPWFAACSSAPSAVPTAPQTLVQVAHPDTSRSLQANWTGDATVVSRTGTGGCGWGTSVDETRQGVLWNINLSGASASLDEDMPNYPTDDVPYTGTVSGFQVSATNVEPGGGVCDFRGGTLTGAVSADGKRIDAMETLTWGAPDNQTIVQRQWILSPIQ
jgi:hypothetical protein